jgi:hypothetical protein
VAKRKNQNSQNQKIQKLQIAKLEILKTFIAIFFHGIDREIVCRKIALLFPRSAA